MHPNGGFENTSRYPLFTAFLAGAAEPDCAVDPAAMESLLTELAAEGQRRWPSIPLGAEALARRLGALHGGEKDPIDALRALAAGDLHLATACLAGVPGALIAFEGACLHALGATIARIDGSPAFADEVRQRVRERLFVTPRGAPAGTPGRIAEYAGRGSLAAWVRVIATRVALDLKNAPRPEAGPAGAIGGDEAAPNIAPEVDYIRRRYRDLFAESLRAAIAALPPEQRNVLRLHFVDGLTLEQVGALFHVHRATAARWIAAARDAIHDEMYRRVREQLGGGASEIESLGVALRSQLDLSLAGMLRDPAR